MWLERLDCGWVVGGAVCIYDTNIRHFEGRLVAIVLLSILIDMEERYRFV